MAVVTLLQRGQRGPGLQAPTPSHFVTTDITSLFVVFDPHPNEMGTTKAVTFRSFRSSDNVTWQFTDGFTSEGPWTGRPVLEIDVTAYHGFWARAQINLPERINCGVLMYVNETPVEAQG
jgi:hypothetical protein